MRIVEDTSECLRTEHDPGPLPGALVSAAFLIAIALAVFYSVLPAVVSLLAALLAAALGVGAWTQAVRTRFEFDTTKARLRWWRRGLGWGRNAELPFNAVRQVAIQMGPGRRSGCARVCLITGSGTEPMARDFSLSRDEALDVAARLRSRLGLEDAEVLEARVRQLLERGSDEDAIAALRAQPGLSADQARELVRHLKES